MCGILLNIGDENIEADHPALDIIRHRGPDGFGAQTFVAGGVKVGLAHRRLSIIDLSERGSQPMSYDEGRLWVTYNGEIYNYIEIRRELVSKGYQFKSDCDTEVLLAAYQEWGKDCLSRFNGMFSFAIYDKRNNSVFMARDRFGVKPLYYWNFKKYFRAVSEIKQFTTDINFERKVNKVKLYHYLNSGDFDFDNETLWEGVYEVPPGHYLELKFSNWMPGDSVKPVCWYTPPFYEEKLKISFEDAIAEFRKKLDESMKLRLRADVPVGFLLSGGLDSSTLVGIAHNEPRKEGAGLKTYSSCYTDKAIDERQFIFSMLDYTVAESCFHFPKPEELIENLDKVIWHNDIPILHGSPVPHWLLYKHIKEENDSRKVIIEGQGADEILCGYGDFYWAFLFENFKFSSIPSFVRQFIAFQSKHKEPSKIILRKYMRLRFPKSVKYPSNHMILADKLLDTSDGLPAIAIRREEPSVADLHRNRLTILRYILHNVDRNSMSQSRETRVPYLDYNLVEFCLRLPSEFKISNGLSKKILREAAKNVLPEKIYSRIDKQGYSSPVARWAQKELSGFFRENLKKSLELPFVKNDNVMASFDKFVKTGATFDPVWWRLINTKRWMDIFKVSL